MSQIESTAQQEMTANGRSRNRNKTAEANANKITKEDIIMFLVMLVVVSLLLIFVGQRVTVEGSSMNDTLQNKDQLICDKFTYNFVREPERYEIVVFRLANKRNTNYIKRIIGLPGEKVQIIDSVIYINGEALDDPYKNSDVFPSGKAAVEITLGDDEYFVMGDNRNNSEDSRFSVGAVKRSQIRGRAVFRIFPFSTFGSLTE